MSIANFDGNLAPPFGGAPYDLTSDMFFAMIESGVFPDEARLYLEEGRLFEKMAKTNADSGLGAHLPLALNRWLPPGWLAFPESQFKLDRRNSPLPDVAVVRCDDARVFAELGRWPEAADLGLAIEIAVTSLAKDLGWNRERYARNAVPNYWVADVPGQRIHLHSRPIAKDGKGEYSEVTIVGPGEQVILVLDGEAPIFFAYEDLMFRKPLPPEPPL